MKLSIQLNGNTVALLIDGDTAQERDGTYNTLFNHEAIDQTSPEQTASGAYVTKTSLARLIHGVANWLQFKSGLEMETERTKYFFEERAKKFIATLPQARILQRHEWAELGE